MKPNLPGKRHPLAAALLLAFSAGPLFHSTADGAQLTLATVPLFLTTGVLPNVLVIYDNSQSMDASMAGKLIAGDNAATRSNIGRQVIRDAISNYRTTFNWGLMSYGMSSNPPAKYNTRLLPRIGQRHGVYRRLRRRNFRCERQSALRRQPAGIRRRKLRHL